MSVRLPAAPADVAPRLSAASVVRRDLDYICAPAMVDEFARLAGKRLLITGRRRLPGALSGASGTALGTARLGSRGRSS